MAPKRKTRLGRGRTYSENMTDDSGQNPPSKKRGRHVPLEETGTIWVDDDTLPSEDGLTINIDEEDDDSEEEDVLAPPGGSAPPKANVEV